MKRQELTGRFLTKRNFWGKKQIYLEKIISVVDEQLDCSPDKIVWEKATHPDLVEILLKNAIKSHENELQ